MIEPHRCHSNAIEDAMPWILSRLASLALLSLLAACAAPVAPPDAAIGMSPELRLARSSLEAWTRPGLDMLQFMADEHQCYVAAVGMPSSPDLILGGVVDVVRIFIDDADQSGAYYACMARRGYRRA
jgi:hypothetical protein